jgi:hypothetical protein
MWLTATRGFLHDLFQFIEEQIQQALSDPSDQFAAVNVAAGAIPCIRRRLEEDEFVKTQMMLLFDNQCCDPGWAKWWEKLAKMPPADFADVAKKSLDTIQVIKGCLRA